MNIAQTIAKELTDKGNGNVSPKQVESAIALLNEGATVPFIARYRKEATGGLDDAQLRDLEKRHQYLNELADRKSVILKSIADQNKLTDPLKQRIEQIEDKASLEDLYLPYKPKRRTRGQIAIEAGLEPLADRIVSDPYCLPKSAAQDYLSVEHQIDTVDKAIEGARYIILERIAEDAQLIEACRQKLRQRAHVVSRLLGDSADKAEKYKDYFDYSEEYSSIPSHRALAIFRGRSEGHLSIELDPAPHREGADKSIEFENIIRQHLAWTANNPELATLHEQLIRWGWKVKLALHLESEFLSQLKERADQEAIDVFSNNLRDLLLAPPAGAKRTLGLDPGLRTGVKMAALDTTGHVLAHSTVFPHAPQKQWDKSKRTLINAIQQHRIELIVIGNGTASRETDQWVKEALKEHALSIPSMIVSEAGASVYSASELASHELPDLDVSFRGAVSIARRIQDPLAELVKIEPKAIGVGQYQHDVNQSLLSKTLRNVVEDCVNRVGVDVNTASPSLLTYVSGLSKGLAENIVHKRQQKGRFNERKELLEVERLGPRAFEQAAGFLRIRDGSNPLDATGVHPESYALVDQLLTKIQCNLKDVWGNKERLRSLTINEQLLSEVSTETLGLATITDIISELERPGRDPRPEFKTAQFKEGVTSIADLTVGMQLEGVISNVTNFGAFVDIGVHQDGLVHISELTSTFITDPRDVVKAGEIVNVRVLELDVKRKRISLSMKPPGDGKTPPVTTDSTAASKKPTKHNKPTRRREANEQRTNGKKIGGKEKGTHSASLGNTLMSDALAQAFAKTKKP